MPTLDVSELNIVLGILGSFIVLYGLISVKIKARWYLGEALPAVLIGILLGPLAAKFIDSERWGSQTKGQTEAITLGVSRVMIGLQLVIAGYQLPAKYNLTRWKEMAMCLLPIMTMMWLCTTLCMLATVPKVTLLAALVIGSCVTCTDPILSQAIAKGPFADKFVARPLREIISSEAGANDGFGFPFLMLAVYLIRHADVPGVGEQEGETVTVRSVIEGAGMLLGRSEKVGRLGGGVGVAMKEWFLETWLYIVFMSVVYGAVVGFAACKGIKFALRRKWIDGESYLLFPTALGMFLVGTCGAIGTDDLLACFVAGNALNWDGDYLAETESRHDEVNSCVDVLLNFGGFMYIGSIMPWDEFNDPNGTGLTYGRLILLGFMVLIFRRIPAIFISYKLMPAVVRDWKEAFFMGYFGPIGAGAVFYAEHSRHLFPKLGEGDEEETNLAKAIGPVVYWLVLFSIVVHGLSIPALNIIYVYMGVKPIQEDAVEIRRRSIRQATPPNAINGDQDTFIAYNRFSRPIFDPSQLPVSLSSNEASTSPRPLFADDDKLRDFLASNDVEHQKRRERRRTIRYGN
ncbi:sodium/hydrogen exchanger family domain-containing protein [Pochonia chlamydosporia 170]|uniref:Sodium/hydrogen exchanger family domain-containing protein n=1 Tax=Pochonia chlamydosporia 170 TaxID=1380566 RepID=A0A179FC01_METCM|nr:sodium/hydrogen exchanger family domain-containing protein [Pochonia chlamydosporia 170]OAQ63002.1 sodium/hydrogen exchanger family domain-containing protein [Pochonia chlamydosporia 170]